MNFSPQEVNNKHIKNGAEILLRFAIFYIALAHYVLQYKICRLVSMLSARGRLILFTLIIVHKRQIYRCRQIIYDAVKE